jgi:hypothetical protein
MKSAVVRLLNPAAEDVLCDELLVDELGVVAGVEVDGMVLTRASLPCKFWT